MLEGKDNCWIFLEPTTYSCSNGEGWFLYNTQNGQHFSSSEKEVIAVLNEIHDRKNLGVTIVDGDIIQGSVILSQFVEDIERKQLGGITSVEEIKMKPIRLLPLLNLQRDIDRLRLVEANLTGKDVGKYLLELNIYVNGICNQTCALCGEYNKQHLCCTVYSYENGDFSLANLDNILKQIVSTNIRTINILGGDILLHPQIEQIASALQKVRQITRIWMNYKNVKDLTIFKDFAHNVIVDFPIDKDCIGLVIQKLGLQDTRYRFLISSVEDYVKVNEIVGDYPNVKYSVLPVYDGYNLGFFQQNVFLDEKDILDGVIPLRKIFANQKMNTNFFGSLTVLPNGDVKANINSKILGNVCEMRLLDLIHTELLENTAWRQIRDSDPCTKCRFQFLCPSPSNLEMIMGLQNLCNVI